jgi:hypothetical protein
LKLENFEATDYEVYGIGAPPPKIEAVNVSGKKSNSIRRDKKQ